MERHAGKISLVAKDLGVTHVAVHLYQRRQDAKMGGPSPKKPRTEEIKSERMRLQERLRKHHEQNTGKRMLPTIAGVQVLSLAMRYLDGGRGRFLELVRNGVLHDQAKCAQWWHVYVDLTIIERERVSFDDVCVAAGVKPKDLLVEMLGVEMDFGREVADLVRAAALPRVMGVLTESAMRPDSEIGERDRMRFLQSMHVLPTPKGAQIVVSANAAAAAGAALEATVPSFLKSVKAIQGPMRTVQQRLAEAQNEPDVFEIAPEEVVEVE